MNYLAHFVLATRLLTPPDPLPPYVVGASLPDLLPLAAPRLRLRSSALDNAPTDTPFENALTRGVRVHLATDAAFHKTDAFDRAQAEIGQMITGAGFAEIRVRRFFLAHILTELALDAALLRAEPSLADDFYGAFHAADPLSVTAWAEDTLGIPIPALPLALRRFAQSRYLEHYAADDGLAAALNGLCARARQPTFDGPNFPRLVTAVTQSVALLTPRVPSLLTETASKLGDVL